MTEPSLLDGLIAYWALEEASGVRRDWHSNNHLADNNTVTQAAGKLGQAAQFTAANGESLTYADTAGLSTGDIDFAVSAWIKLTSKPSNMALLEKGDAGTVGSFEWELFYYATGDRLQFYVSNGSTSVSVTADALGAPALNTWYHVVCWHDAGSNVIGIRINDQYENTIACTSGSWNSATSFRIGGRTGVYFDGVVDGAAIWKRLLTAKEKTALYNGGNGLEYPFGVNRLTEGLIEHWKLDEASGNRTGEFRGIVLSDVNTVGSNAGKIGNAADFVRANSEKLQKADDADISTGDIDFVVAFWMYMNSKSNPMRLCGKFVESTNQREWTFEYNPAPDRMTFAVSGNGTTATVVAANNYGSIPLNTWLFVVGWHDAARNEIGISVNAGTPDTVAHSTGVFDSTSPLAIGDDGSGNYFDGRVDELSYWKNRLLTPAEISALYRGGEGRAFPFDVSLLDSLVCVWPLEEASGTRKDAHVHALDLADNNTAAQAVGKEGAAGQFTRANSEYLSRADDVRLRHTYLRSLTVAAWVYFDSVSANDAFVAKIASGGGNADIEYVLWFSVTANRLKFTIGDGTSIYEAVAGSLGAPSTGTWYFVVGWYDASTDKVYIQVNNGTVDSATGPSAPKVAAAGFALGRYGDFAGSYHDGRLDLVMIWHRVLTPAERTWLYNAGKGINYPELLKSGRMGAMRGALAGIGHGAR